MSPNQRRIERGWTLTALKEHLTARMNRAEQVLDDTLHGFPERYVTKEEAKATAAALDRITERYVTKEQVKGTIASVDQIVKDHVQRREHDDLKARIDELSGGRRTANIFIGVIVTILLAVAAIVYGNQLTSHDVSAQIQTEAPWLADRPQIERTIAGLERQIQVLQAIATREHHR